MERYHLRVGVSKDGSPTAKKCCLTSPSVSWLKGKMAERAAPVVRLMNGKGCGDVRRTDLTDDVEVMVEGGDTIFLFYIDQCGSDGEGECSGDCAGKRLGDEE